MLKMIRQVMTARLIWWLMALDGIIIIIGIIIGIYIYVYISTSYNILKLLDLVAGM